MDEKKSSGLPIVEYPSPELENTASSPLVHQATWLRSTPASPWWHRASSRPAGLRQDRRRRPFFNLGDFRERILLVLLAFCTLSYWLVPWASTPSDPVEAVLKEIPLIDTHIDFPIFVREVFGNHINNLTADQTWPRQVDFPRLHKGKLGAAFWSVWVPCPSEDDDDQKNGRFPDELYADSVAMTFDQIDLVHRLMAHFPDELSMTSTSAAIFHNHQYPPPYRTIGGVIGGEGLHSIGNRVSNLRLFYQLGMRYMTLTHNCHNIYADAAVSTLPPVHNGLSAIGKALVLEMNRMGMMVDISHVSAATMRDVLHVTEAPVIFSHSGARSVCNHLRNVPDDVLDMVKANGGVVQVPFLPEFVDENPEEADLGGVADHIVYIGERIGYEHVGIGSDFDGMFKSVKDLEDVSKYPDLLRELWKRGLSYKQLSGVVGKNLLRVFEKVEAVAAQSTRPPMEDDLSKLNQIAR